MRKVCRASAKLVSRGNDGEKRDRRVGNYATDRMGKDIRVMISHTYRALAKDRMLARVLHYRGVSGPNKPHTVGR